MLTAASPPLPTLPFSPMQAALVDPLPEVRATAAKALGSLVKGAPVAAKGCLHWTVGGCCTPVGSTATRIVASVALRMTVFAWLLPPLSEGLQLRRSGSLLAIPALCRHGRNQL